MLLRPHFANRDDVLIARGGYLCSSCTNASESVAPDCVVAFGVDPAVREARNGYIIAEAGKAAPGADIARDALKTCPQEHRRVEF